MKSSLLVAQYMAVLPMGCVLIDDQVERSLRNAIRKYCGYADLESEQTIDAMAQAPEGSEQDIDLSLSEFAIIETLWKLYLERENSMALEASRSQGAELFGRAVDTIERDILDYEARLPLLCFSSDIVSI